MSPRRHTPQEAARLRERLITVAAEIVRQDGAKALTMRALASEAGCAVGLPYTAFADRTELIEAVVQSELPALVAAGVELEHAAGKGHLADNLMAFATAFLQSPAVALADELMSNPRARDRIAASAKAQGLAGDSFPGMVGSYLAAEKRAGRIASSVDEAAFGYLLASMLHNLIAAGPAWPQPDSAQLRHIFVAVTDAISPSR